MKINWKDITSLAYFELIKLNTVSFPISPKDIKSEDVIITSYQNYAKKTNSPIEKINLNGTLDDAYVIKNLPNMPTNLSIILYDSDKANTRAKHSLLHEIGHIKCGHNKHGDQEEVEAHFFASQMNAPNIIIKEIAKRGYPIDVNSLIEYFGLSEKSAKKKAFYLKKYYFNHINENDDIVLQQFFDFLSLNFPPKTDYYFDELFDEIDTERDNWDFKT